MFTLRNPNLILLLSEACQGSIRYKETSAFGKLASVLPQEVDNLNELLEGFSQDRNHEGFMSEMEADLTTVIRERVSFIRNSISATVEDICHSMESRLDEVTAMKPTITIGVSMIPKIFNSELLVGLTEPYRNHTVRDISFKSGVFPELLPADLMGVINSIEDDEVKEMINDLVDSTPVSIVDIYRNYFGGNVGKGYPNGGALLAPTYIPFMYVERVIAYFLACGFDKNVHEGVNLPLDVYRGQVSTLKANLAKLTYQSIEVLKSTINNERRLLKTVDYSGELPTLVLNKKQYDMLLSIDNCTPETVIGLHLRGALVDLQFDNVEDLDEKSELLELATKSANADFNYRKSINNDNRRVAAIKVIRGIVSQYIDDGKYVLPENQSKLDVMKQCDVILGTAGNYSMDKMFYLVRKLVCCALYPNSGAETYFASMDKYQRENPTIKPREAATLAVRDTLVDYMASQLA
ncbi:hypothetical protein TSMG0078 [Halocynthia phage JM-2012]|uniref:hypothetical protein n=1 Tax=Halocynthia phage JM-2012 TaxID=1173297 RepID=UPI00025C6922|nr:hypothetical protein TSMG0078 [Halocynthia phage JM-2012]AFI55361.1 hypothetical protein TSMG0078 [Halocynthia phage JM-2012]